MSNETVPFSKRRLDGYTKAKTQYWTLEAFEQKLLDAETRRNEVRD